MFSIPRQALEETGRESVSAMIKKHRQITLKCFNVLSCYSNKYKTSVLILHNFLKKVIYSSEEIVQTYSMTIMFSYIMTMNKVTKSNVESSFCFQKLFHSIFM